MIQAIQQSDIRGYEPLDVAAYDLLAPIAQHPALRLTLTNVLNRPVKGELDGTLGKLKLDPARQTLEFAAHETKDVGIPVSGGEADPSNIYPLSLHFDAGADGQAVHEEELHVNQIAQKTIQVDGDLKDWEGVLPHTVKGVDTGPNLTEQAWLPMVEFDESVKTGMATGYLAYDDQFFYFAAKIADSTPYEGNLRFANRDDDSYFYPDKATFLPEEPAPKKEPRVGKPIPSTSSTSSPKSAKPKKAEQPVTLAWPEGVRHFSYRKDPDTPAGNKTDGVQIAFNVIPLGQDGALPNPPGTMPRFMEYRCTDYEFALNPVAERYGGGTETWRLFAPGMPRKSFFPRQPEAPHDGGPVAEGTLAMRREGNTRLVEAALPWSEIPDARKRLDAGETIKFSFRVNDNDGPQYELAANRSVSKINKQAFHDDWETSWANEVEFAFEKR
ncbi:MAG: hypothetical protein NTW86_16755 [Candidatus Sumerlaeota bacterium]|nr:hypothetical protein [Candidatus Sumerlaeota bacterium]